MMRHKLDIPTQEERENRRGDEAERKKYAERAAMWLVPAAVFFPVLLLFLVNGYLDLSRAFHLRELYYTPGLWSMTGAAFWKAFLFETPLALGRGLAAPFMFLLLCGYVFLGLCSLKKFLRCKRVGR